MPKFVISYGFDKNTHHKVIEAENLDEAADTVYDIAVEYAMDHMYYTVEEIDE